MLLEFGSFFAACFAAYFAYEKSESIILAAIAYIVVQIGLLGIIPDSGVTGSCYDASMRVVGC